MEKFVYRDGVLFCENVNLRKLVDRVGTPLYVYSLSTIKENYLNFRDCFKDLNVDIFYSVKANSNITVLNFLKNLGAGFDIVSGGELYRLKTIKVPGEKICFAGVGKTVQEIQEALKYKIFIFNVESLQELEVINKLAGKFNRGQKVALRFNPYLQRLSTISHLSTGLKKTKFGLPAKDILKVFKNLNFYKNIDICGLHMHIGSQILDMANFRKALKEFKSLVSLAERYRKIEIVDIGGGLGIDYFKGRDLSILKRFCSQIKPLIKDFKAKIIIEPGRFIVGNAGVLITKVLYTKKYNNKYFCIVDAAMNDLIRPSLYGVYHRVESLIKKRKRVNYEVVGPICENTDCFAKKVKLPLLSSEDYLVIHSTGAYGMVMSSNYNSRLQIPEIGVMKDRYWIIRERQILKDLILKEKFVDIKPGGGYG